MELTGTTENMGLMMNRDDIEYILDGYGLNRILSDNELTKINLLQILLDHDYIDLQRYLDLEKEVNKYE